VSEDLLYQGFRSDNRHKDDQCECEIIKFWKRGKMMKKYLSIAKHLAVALFVLSVLILGVQSPAQAALTLTLYDGTTTITVGDDTANDSWAGAGVIAYLGSIGIWTVNVSTGISENSAGNLYMDLNSINKSRAAGTLKISLTDTVVPTSATPYTLSVGGTTAGTVTVTSPDTLGPLGGGAFSGSTTGTFSSAEAVLVTEITHSGAGLTSFDTELAAVPIPAAFWLLGSGLMGLIGIRRRVVKG